MPGISTVGLVSRRQAVATLAGGVGLLAAPAIVGAQTPLKVNFVQQRGLLYIPVDIMVSGGILQQEATKLGLGKIEATATALSGPGPIIDALLSGAADYGTAALPSLLTLWEKTRGTANEIKAVGAMSNGAMTLYTINPNVKTLADFTDRDRIAVPTVRLSFNAMMLQMAAEQQWNEPHRLDHLTVALGHPDAVTALSAGYGKATVTAHIAVQPFTDRGLKLPGAHIITDSRKVFGGPLTQITLLATKQTKEKNPTLFKAVANALERIDQGRQRRQARRRRAVEGRPEGAREHRRSCRPAQRPGLRVYRAAAAHRAFHGVSQPHRHHEGKGRGLEGAVLGDGASPAGRLMAPGQRTARERVNEPAMRQGTDADCAATGNPAIWAGLFEVGGAIQAGALSSRTSLPIARNSLPATDRACDSMAR